MHIIHIASELSPIAKVGGLGDVVYGLSKELVRQGHTVEIILPKYDSIDYSLLKNLKVHYRNLWSYEGPYRYNNTIWSAEVDGLSIRLIEPHHANFFFSRGQIYGCDDDIDRFLYFSRAAMEFLFKSNTMADVLHIHDWPTSIIALLQTDMYLQLGMKKIPTVLTLHNLEYQGTCTPKNLTQIGLRGEDYLTPDQLQDPINPLFLNLLKGGIEYAKALTTVSPSYEKEIKKIPGGHGLETTLIKHQKKLHGILNGIDEDFWNPEIDPYLAKRFPASAPFSTEKMELIAEGKKANKENLYKTLQLHLNAQKPLIACITRLVPQKAPFLIAEAFCHILKQGGQCIILGSAHCPNTNQLFLDLQKEHRSHPDGIILLDYNEALSHQIYAASDMFIVPSIFEPCGLTQMIALKYGSIPIVRKTGGLKDTIFDIDTATIPPSERNGFVFEKPEKEDLTKALDRAISLWHKNQKKWIELRKQGMEKDYSWREAAKKYVQLYNSLKA